MIDPEKNKFKNAIVKRFIKQKFKVLFCFFTLTFSEKNLFSGRKKKENKNRNVATIIQK